MYFLNMKQYNKYIGVIRVYKKILIKKHNDKSFSLCFFGKNLVTILLFN